MSLSRQKSNVRSTNLRVEQIQPELRAKAIQTRDAAPPSWTPAKANRRADLVDKDIDGTLTADEKRELEVLQCEMRAARDAVAPVPIEAARALHAQLLSDIARSPEL